MKMAAAPLQISINCRLSNELHFFVRNPTTTLSNASLGRRPFSRSTCISFATRRRRSDSPSSFSTPKKIAEKKLVHTNEEADEDIDADAFEALFQQLEEDLKNNDINGGYDDISEEELAELEKELAEAFADDDLFEASDYANHGERNGEAVVDDLPVDKGGEIGDENVEVDAPIQLKNWQLRRLAFALKNGRRKTSIKNLSGELCLDRAVVLKFLRDPPPSLVMLSATLPDRQVSTIMETEEDLSKTTETEEEHVETTSKTQKPPLDLKVPVHVRQRDWSARKRLKKAHIETLEEVYKRTKRPTNAMVSSIVHVTNLPRQKVLKWFEDKRSEEGVPERRAPYQRSPLQSVFTS